ncbi:MAG: AAC(3) family N-acetyltransferase [bacterium]
MAKRTSGDLARDIKEMGLEGQVVGIHSNLSQIGLVAPTPVSDSEKSRGMSPVAKTIINGILDGIGSDGTLFAPTHSNNCMGGYMPLLYEAEIKKNEQGEIIERVVKDSGFYDPVKSPSRVGALTQSIIFDRRAVRSMHPTHSVAAIGKHADYLVRGHDHYAQPVGIHNAFSKAAGLDGFILFIGSVLEANTTMHAYETLMTPCLSDFMIGVACTVIDGQETFVPQTWIPALHRDFYREKVKRTKAFNIMRSQGLLKNGKFGKSPAFYFHAKETAKYFAHEVFPKAPDILLCDSAEDCSANFTCGFMRRYLKKHLADNSGKWMPEKIRSKMNREFLELLKDGKQFVKY